MRRSFLVPAMDAHRKRKGHQSDVVYKVPMKRCRTIKYSSWKLLPWCICITSKFFRSYISYLPTLYLLRD